LIDRLQKPIPSVSVSDCQAVIAGQVRLVTAAYHNINDEIRPDTLASMIRQSGLAKNLFRK